MLGRVGYVDALVGGQAGDLAQIMVGVRAYRAHPVRAERHALNIASVYRREFFYGLHYWVLRFIAIWVLTVIIAFTASWIYYPSEVFNDSVDRNTMIKMEDRHLKTMGFYWLFY